MSGQALTVEAILSRAPPGLTVRASLERIEVDLPTWPPFLPVLARAYTLVSLLLLIGFLILLQGSERGFGEEYGTEQLDISLFVFNGLLALSGLPGSALGPLQRARSGRYRRDLAALAVLCLPGLVNLVGGILAAWLALLLHGRPPPILVFPALAAAYLVLLLFLGRERGSVRLDAASFEVSRGGRRLTYALDAIGRVEPDAGSSRSFCLNGEPIQSLQWLSALEREWLGALLAAAIRRRRASLLQQGHNLAFPARPPAELLALRADR